MEEAAAAGNPVRAPDRPRVLVGPVTPDLFSAVAQFVDRLPGGSCALDLEGRITYVSDEGAELLGLDTGRLIGKRPWQALPWLDDPMYEDRYRAAVMSRRPTYVTACRPPGHWLRFDLYPDDTGISVRIRPEATDPGEARPPSGDGRPPGDDAPARAGQLYRLIHLAAALTEAASVADVVERATEEIVTAFGARGLAIFHVEDGRLRLTGYHGYAPENIEPFDGVPLDEMPGSATRLMSGTVPTFFTNREEMERVYPQLPNVVTMKAWAVLPLIVSGRPVGTCVLAYDRPHRFPVGERAVLTALAGVIAQALDRARLFDAKHQVAHGLQDALLPRVLPDIPGLRVHARYLPGAEGMNIGGDFYDLIRLGPAGAAAVIGDVQGHNVAAAALMGQVRTAIHAHIAAGAPPDDVLARTNRLLIDLDTNLFTSCLYAHIDLARHRVRFANAGHPPPILWRPGHRSRVLEVPPGLLLGVDPGAAYPVTEAPLPPGAVLALYTDGLVEAPGSDIEHAINRLAGALSATPGPVVDLVRAADTALRGAPAPGRHTDDIALLLLQTRP